jgi:glucose/arabinose dehydrogenase
MRVFAAALATLAPAAGACAQVALSSSRLGAQNEFAFPTFLAQPSGESRRLYITEKTGAVRVFRDGAAQSTPVLSGLAGLVPSGECGLLGLAFHPQFQSNGYMYILYQTTAAPAGTRIARYTLNPVNPEAADPASVLSIMTIARSPTINHQGGWIGFGPDGSLYISSGDGGDGANAQPLTTLLGKVLRIDVNADGFPGDPERHYDIPATNPFAGAPGALPEIWASGLRNPWRCSFDRQTGDLWIADVGNVAREELNFQPAAIMPPFAARNYGWPCMEGTLCQPASPGCECMSTAYTLPVYEYGRSFGNSIIGGYVYRGAAIPALRGHYLCADLGGAKWSFRPGPPVEMQFATRTTQLLGPATVAFGEDNQGELYYCTIGAGVFKIIPACAANCDGSTAPPALNVGDFSCFLQRFAAGDHYANCDASTQPPVLNVADFTCFLQRFAGGCP